MEMETPSGPMQMFFVGEYREIDPKTRLVYTESVADADGNISLHWAVLSGSMNAVESLLNHGCDVNAANKIGDTPL